jgi:hypothetical protein
LLISLAACQTAPPQAADTASADARQVVDPTELVALAAGFGTADRLVGVAAERGYQLERRDTLAGLDLVLMTFRLPPDVAPADAIRELEAREPATTVGINHAYRDAPTTAPSPVPRRSADGLLGWPTAGCAAQVPVGLIDTALDPNAPGLSGATVTSRDISARASGGGTAHGTAVAELLAGPGRLTGVRLYHATVVGEVPGANPAAGVDDIMRALDWLRSQDVRVVNISLAGPYNKILDRGLKAAADRGMVIVAAAGNDGAGAPPRYPAASDSVIAVTALDADLRVYGRAPRGDHVDFAAPGVDIFVPLEGGRYMTGTSLSAPFVTALIAADAASAGSVEAARASLARRARDLGAPGRDDTFGAGLPTAPATCGSATMSSRGAPARP